MSKKKKEKRPDKLNVTYKVDCLLNDDDGNHYILEAFWHQYTTVIDMYTNPKPIDYDALNDAIEKHIQGKYINMLPIEVQIDSLLCLRSDVIPNTSAIKSMTIKILGSCI